MEGRKTSDRIAHRKEQLSKELIQRHNERNCVEHMSDAQIVRQNDRHRVEHMSDAQIERQNDRHRVEHMSVAQIERQNDRHRVEHMSVAQIERQKDRHRVEHMSDSQIQRQRNYRNSQNRRFVSIQQQWDDENPCEYCHCTFLKSVLKKARKRCCNNGEYLQPDCAFPKLEMLPETLKWLCLQRGEHFGKTSAKYNNILSIGSTGVENNKGGGYETIIGDAAVKMNGRSYHFLSNSGKRFSGINYFTFDGLEDAKLHLDQLNNFLSSREQVQKKKLEKTFLTAIFNELRSINEFAQELKWIGEGLRSTLLPEGLLPQLDEVHQLIAALNVQTSTLEVGCMLSDESEGNIVYKFSLKGMGNTIRSDSDLIEPLCYVLLFPFAEKGWCTDIRETVGFVSYMYSRFKIPEQTYESAFDEVSNEEIPWEEDNPYKLLRKWNKDHTKLLATNRFQLMTRVSQYFLVEQFSRALDFRLGWHKKKKGYIFGQRSMHDGSAEEEEDADIHGEDTDGADVNEENTGGGEQDDGGGSSNTSSYLAASFSGSPRHLNDLAHNALTIVTELGDPDIFITGTTNPLWPEIQERLFPSQTAFDRPDIVIEVFHARLGALVHNLRNGKYFGGRQAIYDLRVIEYQHRGLPHFHLVCKLTNMPQRDNQEAVLAWIDE